ncbi:CRISPR-associated endonuclease Cas1 [Vibrio spartinae]|uniref:CRISPR-associated endonuclease Cas1 n=1 Tax=Vibrio spartinae TaxID=1918945 RepID=A0ABX6R4D7_9VIBR|nr:CRISPR-associated endonuclease Cas1 [Vibrio spartinae]QMV16210.1 CRISPR-associated protein Cas4/endonuclease Cas1 fusion [Vibrio spartinae]
MTNPPLNTIEPIAALLPLRSICVCLRLTETINLTFMHHVPLHAWVRNLCGSPQGFSDFIAVQPLENGHIHYQPGDFYRFQITALANGGALLQTLIERLSALPDSAERLPQDALFHHNLTLHSIHCCLSGHPVAHLLDCTPYQLEQLAETTEWWQQQPGCLLRSMAPMRLKTADKDATGKHRYCRDKTDFTPQLLLQRLQDTFIQLIQHQSGIRYSRDEAHSLQLTPQLSIWVGHQYGRQPSATKASGRKDMSGALLQARLGEHQTLPRWLMALLILGQWIGIGQSRAFGLGRYRLFTPDGMTDSRFSTAAHALLPQYLTEPDLRQALEDSSETAVTADQQAGHLAQIRAKADLIIEGRYQAPTLQPVEIDKPNGGTRKLSIPPWQDRVLQKAVCHRFSETLDQLWKPHSYGYRRGMSRFQARDEINRHIQAGYRWVLESDVDSFFDSVDWENLATRLQLLLPHEPLTELLMQWVTAPAYTESGDTQQRRQGLPQGAPVSPLLANLILDDFDGDMLALDYRLVRYADDFVLLFKTRQAAEQALPQVTESLQEHGLTIKASKTRIVEATQGFRYLGFLFIDGYAIETATAYRDEQQAIEEASPGHVHQLRQQQQRTAEIIGERQQFGTFLIIAGDVAYLNCEHQRLKVTQEEEDHYYSWHELEGILLIGPHHITTPALREAMRHTISVHFASRFGSYEGVSCAGKPHQGHQLWLHQLAQFQQTDFVLGMIRNLVLAKINGHLSLIRNRQPDWPGLERLKRIKTKVHRSEAIETIRGYEGEAAKHLWAFFRQHLDPQWQFNGRNKRPPKDPVNALLSLGYTHLYHLTDTLIQSCGLCPWVGFYHQNHGTHKTLASDLMEPFRVIVERTVLTLINKGQITPDDFTITTQGCEMTQQTRKTLLTALMSALTQLNPKTKQRLLDAILQQSREVQIAIKLSTPFHPWTPE